MEAIVAQLIGGAIGGTGGGKVVKASDLGNIGNMIAGAVGGVGGGALLNSILGMAGPTVGGVDIAALAGQLVGGGIAGAIVQIIVGMVINKVIKKA